MLNFYIFFGKIRFLINYCPKIVMSIYIDTRVTNYLYTLFSVCFSMVKTIIKPVHLLIICNLIILFVLVISYNNNNAKLITASKL